jgi:hypothetical protein
VFTGIGDNTKVYADRIQNRVNDGKKTMLYKVNSSDAYLKSKIIKIAPIWFYVLIIRTLKSKMNHRQRRILKLRLQFNQKLFKLSSDLNTLFDTNSDLTSTQEFTYIEVETGQGAYT